MLASEGTRIRQLVGCCGLSSLDVFKHLAGDVVLRLDAVDQVKSNPDLNAGILDQWLRCDLNMVAATAVVESSNTLLWPKR